MRSTAITEVHQRWLIRRDYKEVLAIESDSFEFAWDEQDFLRCLRQKHCIGMVAETEGRIVGYMIYELHKDRLHLVNFAVAPVNRRSGIGTLMIEKLKSKLSSYRRTRVTLEVRDSNLAAQLFFRSQGFRAVQVLRNHYEDSGDDAYIMAYSFGG